MKTPPLLVEDVKNYLKSSIANGKIKPGEKITEISLQKKWEISRSPIREALRSLEREGLIVIVPRKGAFVSEITVDELNDTTVILATLEALAVELAIPNYTTKDLNKLEKLLQKMTKEAKDFSINEYTQTHDEFHRALRAPCKNAILIEMIDNIRARHNRPKVTAFIFVHHNIGTGVTEHHNLLTAIKNEEIKKAAEIAKFHVIQSFSRALDDVAASAQS